jgi:hypothetical protein
MREITKASPINPGAGTNDHNHGRVSLREAYLVSEAQGKMKGGSADPYRFTKKNTVLIPDLV